MASLKAMCNNEMMTLSQRNYFWQGVDKYLSRAEDKRLIARGIMSDLWISYDYGGHSVGRSLRSALLERLMFLFDQGDYDKTRLLLSFLIAMYFDYEYINSRRWFDFRLDGIQDLPLHERIELCAVALLLGLDDIPDLSQWSDQQIFELTKD